MASIDAFRGFTDDPYLVGRVGAVNALSDLWAKGVRPRWALALVALPETAPGAADEEELFQVLAGARSVLDAAGVTLAGGHTTTAAELMVGFSVEGLAGEGEPLRRLDGLRPGRSLVLSKPLGTGVLFHADMEGELRGPWFVAALAAMQRTNAAAAEVAAACGATAATDVTGFGLAGHLGAMTRASGVGAAVVLEALPVLPGALELLAPRRAQHLSRRELAPAAAPCRSIPRPPRTPGWSFCSTRRPPAGCSSTSTRSAPTRRSSGCARAGCAEAAVIGETSAASGPPGGLAVRRRW